VLLNANIAYTFFRGFFMIFQNSLYDF